MDEPRIAKTQGMDLALTPRKDGRIDAELLDGDGGTLFTSDYATEGSALSSVRAWILKHYQAEEIVTTPKPKPVPKPRPRPLGPAPDQLVDMMDARADDNEARAVQMRQEAEALEMEAKRLRAAVDVMREGHADL
jgi:hypothetical protein